VEGPAKAVDAFIAWAHEGSPFARVTEVVVEDMPPQGFRSFRIVR